MLIVLNIFLFFFRQKLQNWWNRLFWSKNLKKKIEKKIWKKKRFRKKSSNPVWSEFYISTWICDRSTKLSHTTIVDLYCTVSLFFQTNKTKVKQSGQKKIVLKEKFSEALQQAEEPSALVQIGAHSVISLVYIIGLLQDLKQFFFNI